MSNSEPSALPAATQHYRAGNLDAAIASAKDAVREAPGNADARQLLAWLACFDDDLEFSDRQFETLAGQPGVQVAAMQIQRRLVQAALERRETLHQGRVPVFDAQDTESLKQTLRALSHVRAGDHASARATMEPLWKRSESLHANCGGQTLAGWRDGDDLFALVLEFATPDGCYRWASWAEVRSLVLMPATDLRDLWWRPAKLELGTEPARAVWLPAIYPTAEDTPGPLKLGQATDWTEAHPGWVRGQGQRMWFHGGHELPFHQLPELRIKGADASS